MKTMEEFVGQSVTVLCLGAAAALALTQRPDRSLLVFLLFVVAAIALAVVGKQASRLKRQEQNRQLEDNKARTRQESSLAENVQALDSKLEKLFGSLESRTVETGESNRKELQKASMLFAKLEPSITSGLEKLSKQELAHREAAKQDTSIIAQTLTRHAQQQATLLEALRDTLVEIRGEIQLATGEHKIERKTREDSRNVLQGSLSRIITSGVAQHAELLRIGKVLDADSLAFSGIGSKISEALVAFESIKKATEDSTREVSETLRHSDTGMDRRFLEIGKEVSLVLAAIKTYGSQSLSVGETMSTTLRDSIGGLQLDLRNSIGGLHTELVHAGKMLEPVSTRTEAIDIKLRHSLVALESIRHASEDTTKNVVGAMQHSDAEMDRRFLEISRQVSLTLAAVETQTAQTANAGERLSAAAGTMHSEISRIGKTLQPISAQTQEISTKLGAALVALESLGRVSENTAKDIIAALLRSDAGLELCFLQISKQILSAAESQAAQASGLGNTMSAVLRDSIGGLHLEISGARKALEPVGAKTQELNAKLAAVLVALESLRRGSENSSKDIMGALLRPEAGMELRFIEIGKQLSSALVAIEAQVAQTSGVGQTVSIALKESIGGLQLDLRALSPSGMAQQAEQFTRQARELEDLYRQVHQVLARLPAEISDAIRPAKEALTAEMTQVRNLALSQMKELEHGNSELTKYYLKLNQRSVRSP